MQQLVLLHHYLLLNCKSNGAALCLNLTIKVLTFLQPPLSFTQAVSAVAAEDGVRFMQEMMELSSQQQKEQLPPRAIQIVSHPFFGRVVLTAGPAQFGTDLSKSSTGVSGVL